MEKAVGNIDVKIGEFENNLELVKKSVGEKDKEILKLQERIKISEEKIKFLEEKITNILEDGSKLKDLEEKQTNLIEESKEKYKCNICDF